MQPDSAALLFSVFVSGCTVGYLAAVMLGVFRIGASDRKSEFRRKVKYGEKVNLLDFALKCKLSKQQAQKWLEHQAKEWDGLKVVDDSGVYWLYGSAKQKYIEQHLEATQ